VFIFWKSVRTPWMISLSLLALSFIAGIGMYIYSYGYVGLAVLAFIFFLIPAAIPLGADAKLTVTPTEIEFETLVGWKVIKSLNGVRFAKLNSSGSEPDLVLVKNWFSAITVPYAWREAYPAILEATQALNLNVEIDGELLERYGQPPYGIFGR
jgi:hypothetical protein